MLTGQRALATNSGLGFPLGKAAVRPELSYKRTSRWERQTPDILRDKFRSHEKGSIPSPCFSCHSSWFSDLG